MKKPTILLVSAYKGFRTTYTAVLSGSFHVIAREKLPDPDDFIIKRVRLLLIINQWEYIPDYAVYDFADTVKLPVLVVVDAEHADLEQYAQRSIFLTVLVNPISNDQLLTALHKVLNESASPHDRARKERRKTAEQAFKSAYKSPKFRRKIEKILKYLHENYADVDNFQKLAESFDINYESMQRAVEHKTDNRPQEYLRELRFEKMLQFMQFTHLNTEEICIEVGFRDVHHARKLFRDKYGITIEECIAQLRLTGKPV